MRHFRHDYPLAVEPATTPRPLVQKKIWRNSLPIDMLLSAMSVLVVAQSSLEIPDGLMNNPACVKNQQIHQFLIQFINYVWYLLHVSALHCHLQRAFLVPSERCSIEEQLIEYCGCGVLCLVTWCTLVSTDVHSAHHVTRHNTPHPQYSID